MHAAKVIRDTLLARGITSFEFVINQFDTVLSGYMSNNDGCLGRVSSGNGVSKCENA